VQFYRCASGGTCSSACQGAKFESDGDGDGEKTKHRNKTENSENSMKKLEVQFRTKQLLFVEISSSLVSIWSSSAAAIRCC